MNKNQKDKFLPYYIDKPNFYKNKIFIFMDIKGFTPLCNKYIKDNTYGAEKIGDLLNDIFFPIINIIYDFNGDVISFAGDALFIAVDKKYINSIKKRINFIINNYNKINRTKLSLSIEKMKDKFFPIIIKTKNNLFFTYYNDYVKQNIKINKNIFPEEVYEISKSKFKGELRNIPIFFLHIDKNIHYEHLKSLFISIIDNAKKYSIYLNKIEYLDKGWMILVSSGAPIININSQYRMYDFLIKTIKRAKEKKIPLKIGGTLQKGYIGIIGNNIRAEYTFIGSNVNLAARIAFNGEDYTILSDKEFAKAVEEKLNSQFLYTKRYKGIDEQINIYKIKNYKKDIKSVFVGREKEIKTCYNFLKKNNTALFIIGKSGIGKTVFANKVLSLLHNKHILLKGIYNNHNPFYIFDELIKQYGKNIKDTKRECIQKTLKRLKNVTIFIDDIAFADRASVDIIKWLLSQEFYNINLIITAFDKKDIDSILKSVIKFKTELLYLENLKQNDIAQLYYEYIGIKANKKILKNIYKITKGNPLFVVYLIKFIGDNKYDIPYSLKEIILLRIKQLPYKGENFMEGAAVYGDIFNGIIVSRAIKFNKKQLEHIIISSEQLSMLYRLKGLNTVMFANTIIRETVFNKLLEKKINYIRVQLANILLENSNNKEAMQIAFQLLYLADNERCLDILMQLLKIENDFELLRDCYEKYIRFVLKHKKYSLKTNTEIIEKASSLPLFYFTGELIELTYKLSIKIKRWNNREKTILTVASSVASVLMDYEKTKKLLNIYKKLKGEDKYYKWYRIVLLKYSIPHEEILKTYKELLYSFDNKEKIQFYMNLLAFSFFVTANKKYEEIAKKTLRTMEKYMDDNEKASYYFLIASINMHRDIVENSIYYLNKIKTLKLDNKYYKFLVYNDLAIAYTQIAVKNLDNSVLRKADRYMRKSFKFANDSGMKSHLPLLATNVAMSYARSGKTKLVIDFLHRALIYGKTVNHPIEVPYTKSRIAIFLFDWGLYDYAYDISNQIVNNDKVEDIIPISYTIMYILKHKQDYYNKAVNMSKDFLKHGVGKCMGEVARKLFYAGIYQNNKDYIKKSYKLMKDYVIKSNRREVHVIIDNIIFESQKIILENNNTKKLKQILKRIDSFEIALPLKAIGYYILWKKENKKNYFHKAIYYSKITRLYPLLDIMNVKYNNKRFIKNLEILIKEALT